MNVNDYLWSIRAIRKNDPKRISFPCSIESITKHGNHVIITAEVPPECEMSQFVPTQYYTTQTRGDEEK